MTASVSIIVPVFDAANTLEACLQSIFAQNYPNFEVLVLDGGSTDGSQAIISNFSDKIAFARSHPDDGIYAAMNEGIQRAKNDWLLFLGADDVLTEDALQKIFEQPIPSATKLLLGNVQIIGPKHSKVPSAYVNRMDGGLSWRNTIHHQGCFYHKRCFGNGQPEGYDLRFKILADYDTNLRLRTQKATAIYRNETIALARAEGISKQFDKVLYKEELALKKKWFGPSAMLLQQVWVWVKFLYKRF